MKIEPKFNIGDEVWTISSSAVIHFKVVGITIYIHNDNSVTVKYIDTWDRSPYDNRNHEYYEDSCFGSKEALCQSILNKEK